MIKNLMILTSVMALIGGYTWYEDYRGKPSNVHIPAVVDAKKAQAPDFKFQSWDGKNYTLSQFKGKPVVLNFWASWCAPCVVEFPQMVKLATTRKDSMFIFISTDDSKQPIERFIAKYGQNLPANVMIGTDFNKSISQDLYQTFKVPETYLINSNGVMREKIVGANVDWISIDMQQKIDALKTP